MDPHAALDILMATYNGERFLREQLDSILGQSAFRPPGVDWRLLIRDDGSSDGTVSVLREYSERYPDRVCLVEDGMGNLGASRNFGRLLSLSSADYIMFADQDDVWLPDKVAMTFEKMQGLEGRFGKDMPLLVHTDLKVVDRDLDPISESFWRYMHLDPGMGRALNRLLVQNAVTGNTVMANRALRTACKGIPAEAVMFDWWLALLAAAFGKVDYVDAPTVLYRQHGGNAIGAKMYGRQKARQRGLGFDIGRFRKYIREGMIRERVRVNLAQWKKDWISPWASEDAKRIKRDLLDTQRQGGAFLRHHGKTLKGGQLRMVDVYSRLSGYKFPAKLYYIFRYSFLPKGFPRVLWLIKHV